MKFEELSEWIVIDGYCATRIIKDGDPENVKDRVAFIEKTPRVRLKKNKYIIEKENDWLCDSAKTDAWVYGAKGTSEYGMDEDSRKWCDNMLVLLGWE